MNQTRDVLPTGSAAPPRLAHWLALSLLGTSFLMVVLDQTIVYVALPSIQPELGLAEPHLQWVMTSFLLSFGAALLTVSGRIASALGPRRMFTLGLSLFTVASLSRGVQGAGAGFLIGGPIADGPGWRWIFLSTVPIGLALTALALIVLPGNETATTGRRLELLPREARRNPGVAGRRNGRRQPAFPAHAVRAGRLLGLMASLVLLARPRPSSGGS